jgi:hypothetical protein
LHLQRRWSLGDQELTLLRSLNRMEFQMSRSHVRGSPTYEYDTGAMPGMISLPSAPSSNLAGISLSLTDVLARIPGLDRLYEQTFRTPAKSAPVSITNSYDHWELRIDDPEVFHSLDDVVRLVAKWRSKFPFIVK